MPDLLAGETAPDRPLVALLVDDRLHLGIRLRLDRFKQDLLEDGYSSIEQVTTLLTPGQLRDNLRNLRELSRGRLTGAILLGQFPHVYQWVRLSSSNPEIPPTEQEVISFQYYSDLDGTFRASPDYRSLGGRSLSYDVHEGHVEWEVWIGVLPFYKGDVARTIDAINRYLDKNHAYRTGGLVLPRAFLEVSEHFVAKNPGEFRTVMEGMKSGPYAWRPWSDAAEARIYFESKKPALTVDAGYADLSAGAADFTALHAHGYWGASGRLDIPWVETQPVRTHFFWSDGCAIADMDRQENFLAAALYSPTSSVLVAKGTTNNSGGLGTNEDGHYGKNIATAMSQGRSIGQALLDHVNVPLIDPWSRSREFHYASPVLLGDPSLGRRPV